MTDALLLREPELLLQWSASLDFTRLSFDQWLDQTGGSNVDPYESCADDAGHSVRVAKVAGKVAGGR
jgi:hypothetical protein